MIDASPRRLQVFKTVVDLGGFNAAAQHLGIAQPSVGAHVAGLERQAGHTLLRRHRGAKPVLTDAGRAVYALAADVVRRSEETAQLLAALKAGQSREIAIAVHRDLALSGMASTLGRFARANPKTRVVTRIGTIEDVIKLVQSDAVQVGVLLAAGAVPGLQSQIVGREPLVMVAGPGHPLASRVGLVAAELRRFGFITGLRHSRFFRLVDSALRAMGLGDYVVALEMQEAAAAKQAVWHGTSIACLPRCTVQEEIASGELVALDLAKPMTPLQIRCVFAGAPSPPVARLMTALKG